MKNYNLTIICGIVQLVFCQPLRIGLICEQNKNEDSG